MKQKTINHFWALQHKETGYFLNENISIPYTKYISTCFRSGSRNAMREFRASFTGRYKNVFKIVKITCVIN